MIIDEHLDESHSDNLQVLLSGAGGESAWNSITTAIPACTELCHLPWLLKLMLDDVPGMEPMLELLASVVMPPSGSAAPLDREPPGYSKVSMHRSCGSKTSITDIVMFRDLLERVSRVNM